MNEEAVQPQECQMCQEYLDGWRRAKADYANLQKEAEKRGAQIGEYVKILMLQELIPIYENFKGAFHHVSQEDRTKDWVVGIGHIQKQLEIFLRQEGVEEIKTVGQMFDPTVHEAVSTKKVDGKKEGEITEELRGGYQVNGKTLMPAKVIVCD